MGDLKLYTESDHKLKQLIEAVHTYSQDINMEFGMDKCSKCSIKKGMKIATEHIQLSPDRYIQDLAEDATYKYLGIEENTMIEHRKMREKVQKEYLKRLKSICTSELSSINKITAINQYAIPVVTYGFGIVDWPQRDLDKLDAKTRKMLTLHKVTYRNQCIDRLYVPRRVGGLGLMEINQVYRTSIVSMGQYIKSAEENIMKRVAQHHEETLSQTSVIKLAENFGGI